MKQTSFEKYNYNNNVSQDDNYQRYASHAKALAVGFVPAASNHVVCDIYLDNISIHDDLTQTETPPSFHNRVPIMFANHSGEGYHKDQFL